MSVEKIVATHYGTGGVYQRILDGLAALGISPENATPADLKPVDEFHIGGAQATRDLLAQIGLAPEMHVLDIGAGIGGTPRLIAADTGCRVTGIDLTQEYVETAALLSDMVGLGERTSYRVASATALPFDDASFDAATMLHVGMNIADKAGVMAEAARVLKPGAHFAVYDVMRTGEDALVFPLPWATTPEGSFVAPPEDYEAAARAAGFTVAATRVRRDFALEFFAAMRARMTGPDGPPALGLHLLLGPTAGEKVANMVANITEGRVAPVELILRAPT